MIVRAVRPDDWLAWERMRYALWPGEDEEHGEVTSRFFADVGAGEGVDPQHVLLAVDAGTAVGFAELSIRSDLPGFAGQRVGYIEGMYVAEPVRLQGVATALLRACRAWAQEQGCDGFASDREDRIIVDRNFTADPRSIEDRRSTRDS